MKKWLAPLALIATASAETSLTIYNDGFATIRESVPLSLKNGESQVSFDRATAMVQPDSVVLRDPTEKNSFKILEQGYRNDPVSEGLLLQQFEGKEIEFVTQENNLPKIIKGKVIRSGYQLGGGVSSPIIEVDGKLQFSLPGQPHFPALGDQNILRPTLNWTLSSEKEAKFDAQLSYITRGLSWEASYNIVAPEKGTELALSAWITLSNKSGTDFKHTQIKCIAGEVNRTRRPIPMATASREDPFASVERKAVEEKPFDDFHLYSLGRSLDLKDQETKQVEFISRSGIHAKKEYRHTVGLGPSGDREKNLSPSVTWKFLNTEANQLGIPLPAGTVRFYRSDSQDQNLEFVGENSIDHTPKNQEISLTTGKAFDVKTSVSITNLAMSTRGDHVSSYEADYKITIKNSSAEEKTITTECKSDSDFILPRIKICEKDEWRFSRNRVILVVSE
jgi:hypothetical protein